MHPLRLHALYPVQNLPDHRHHWAGRQVSGGERHFGVSARSVGLGLAATNS